jgi:hypothetical protein
MSKRWAITLALTVALTGAALPAGGDTGPEPLHQFELVRTTTGPSSIEFAAHLSPPDGWDMDAFAGMVAVRTDEDGAVLAVEPGYASTIGHNNEPEVYHDGEEVASAPCETPPCVVTNSGGATVFILMEDDGGPGAMNRYYVVFEGADVNVAHFKVDGWELHETTGLTYRYVDWRRSQGAGAAAFGHGVTFFNAAEADGGAQGSVAMAIPPCSNNAVPGGAGAGLVTLRGGQHESTAQCPSLLPVTAGHAQGAVRWRAEGTAVGDNTLNEVPLFVLDLPPCERRVAGVAGEVEGVTCG